MNAWPTLAHREFRQESATLTKRERRRCEHSTAAFERSENRRLERSNLFACARAGCQLLHDHCAEKRRRKCPLEKRGQRLGERLIAERIHEHVRIERELHV